MNIEITNEAQDYLLDLITNQDSPAIKMCVVNGGTPRGETTISYWDNKVDNIQDFQLQEGLKFPVYKELKSLSYLEDAKIDYSPDKFGGTLTVKAPNSKVTKLSENPSIEDKINHELYTEINPAIAAHGGEVRLVEVLNGDTAVLEFGGGCQGCSSVDFTLKAGVEVQLRKAIPELKEITDITDHSYRENAYYS